MTVPQMGVGAAQGQAAQGLPGALPFRPHPSAWLPLLLMAALFAAPLAFGAVRPWAWASLAVLASLLIFLWSVEGVRQGALRIAWSPLYVPGVLFFLLAAFQFLSHRTLDPIATRESLLKLATDLLFFFLAVQFLARAAESSLRAFGLAVALYTLALALFAIIQYFSSNGLIYWVAVTHASATFGPYVDRDHYAGLMEMLVPLAACYAFSRRRELFLQCLLGFGLLLAVASLLLCGSRGGFVSLLAEVLIVGLVLFRCAPADGRRRVTAMGGLGLTMAALLFFYLDPGYISKELATVASVPRSPEVTLGDRLTASRDSLRLFRAYPWTGTGLGSFEVAYPAFESVATDYVWAHTHNDYAEALAETGLAGGLLILAALVLFFRRAFRNLAERLRRERGWTELGGALGCCGLLVHSLVDFNLHLPANAAWFVLCLAIATTRQQKPIESRNWNWKTETGVLS